MAEKDEFESIALPHLDSMYRFAVAICRDSQIAEDLVQTTFLKAFEQFDSFEKGTNCKAWLSRILRNKWFDQLRHSRVAGETLTIEEQMVAAEDCSEQITWTNCQDLLENFSDEQVITALKKLPDQQRMVLFLVDVEQLSQAETADVLDIAVGTVKSRTSRARKMLKKELLVYAKEMGYLGGEK